MTNLDYDPESPVTAKLVAQKDRIIFMPKHLGMSRLLTAENTFYIFMQKLSKDYNGGKWDFYELSNGGFYLAPQMDHLCIITNHSRIEVTGDAAGIIVTLYTLSHWLNQYTVIDDAAGEKLYNQYYMLRNYINDHAESAAIFRAIN